jgi:hypothetical protein
VRPVLQAIIGRPGALDAVVTAGVVQMAAGDDSAVTVMGYAVRARPEQ